MSPKVAILDAGSQFAKVIDRKVRELNIESEIFPLETTKEQISKDIEAIIISGGPESVLDENAPQIDKNILDMGIPILGICYGFQLLNKLAGGEIEKKSIRQDGPEKIEITKKDSELFRGLSSQEQVLMSHGDSLKKVGKGFEITAYSGNIIASIEDTKKKFYALQFHPEVDITTNGSQILGNFLKNISHIEPSFTLEDRKTVIIKEIKETVGNKKVLLLVSGGVDSTVLTALMHEALPKEQIVALHIDNGFMRDQESEKVKQALENIGIKLDVIDAKESFHNATTIIDGKETKKLKDTVNPEEKRKIIGDTFIKIAEEVIQKYCKQNKLNTDDFVLAQGTLRPDLIESGSGIVSKKADTIKTHHNDTGLVRALREQGKVIEPLKDLHKDEVRKLGISLGLPEHLVWRQPFPGPGLAIRILCAGKPFIDEKFEKTQKQMHSITNYNGAPETFQNYIQKHFPQDTEILKNMSKKLSAHLLPIQTVGTQGDARSYNYAVGISGNAAQKELQILSSMIPKIHHNVNRVVYIYGEKITSSPKEITPTFLGYKSVQKLQKADKIVNDILYENNLIKKLSQVPVILVPLPFGKEGNHSIVLRPFITNDFMTGVPAKIGSDIPHKVIQKIIQQIQEIPGISRVMYDMTPKPPGTTEWE